MDTFSLASKLISLFSSSGKGSILENLFDNLLENKDLINKILSSIKEKDANDLSNILKGITDDELLERIKSVVDMVEKGEISTENMSDMIEKISGRNVDDVFNGFKKLF